jgi:tryptophan 2,3-dioxygenase
LTRLVRATGPQMAVNPWQGSKNLQRNRQRIALRGHHHAQLATRLSAALHARHLLDVAQAQRPAAGLAVTADGDDVAGVSPSA